MEKLSSLNELAQELMINKSTLNYYVMMNVIEPVDVVGKMQLFDKEKTIKRINWLREEMKKGKTIKEILNSKK